MTDDRTYKVGLELDVRGSSIGGLRKAAKETKAAAAVMTSSLNNQRDSSFQAMRALSSFGGQVRSVASMSADWGRSMVSSAMSTAAAYASMATKLGAAGIAGAAGLAAVKGFQMNASMEATRNTIAGTLQLFNHSATAADQLGANIRVAEASMQRLITIANNSPGELDDVQNLFQNMLPGARAITGDMERILALTQKTAMLTPVIGGGDFITTGSQISRMLTGGAGAEMDSWKRLQSVILEVGQSMNKSGSTTEKVFGKSLQMGEKLTMEFNKLSGEDRLRLLETAMSRAGPEMEKMFAESWEGASSTFKSGWKQIAKAGMKPLYEATKAALIRANAEGGVFSNERMESLKRAAESVGKHFAAMGEKAFDLIGRGIVYLDNNWQDIANSIYHGFQYGALAVKAAFAYGFARMAAGSAIVAASMGVRGIGAAGRGIVGAGRAGFAVGRGAQAGVAGAVGLARMVKDFGSFKSLGSVLKMAAGGAGLLMMGLMPLAGVAIVAAGALSAMAITVGGIAVYVASEWDTLMADVKKGFDEGTLTLRPLVEQALLLWEKLKLVGEALLGGATGGDLAKTAIDTATGAVETLSGAVVTLGELAADFFDFVAEAKDMLSGESKGIGSMMGATQQEQEALAAYSQFGIGDSGKVKEIQDAIKARREQALGFMEQYGGSEGAAAAAAARSATDMLESTAGDAWRGRSGRLREALKKVQMMSVKDLDLEEVDRLTAYLENQEAYGPELPPTKTVKGPSVNIGTFNYNADLRGDDPDRAMVGLVNRMARVAQRPTASSFSPGGF